MATHTAVRRFRASPSNLVKLCKTMSQAQLQRVGNEEFGGLLNIACKRVPVGLASCLMVDCYDAETRELVLQGRGRIPVNAEAVHNVLGLHRGGDPVIYGYDLDALNFIHKAYQLQNGEAPEIKAILKLIKDKDEADDEFFRSWLMIAVSTFLCPTTGLSISPRCYPAVVDLTRVKELDWCQFVADQIHEAATNINKKNSIRGCLLFLVILYVDSLDVGNLQIPDTKPRIAAWTWKNLKGPGIRGHSLFRMDDITSFVYSSVHNGMSLQNKRKLSHALGEVCVGFTELMGKFLHQVSEVDASSAPQSSHAAPGSSNAQRQTRTKRQRTSSRQPHPEHNGDPEEDSGDDSDYVMESEEDYETEEDRDAEDYETEEDIQPDEIKVQNGDAGQGENNTVSANEGTDEDHMPLITRLRMIGEENNKNAPTPLMVDPPDKDKPTIRGNNSVQDKGKYVNATRAKLKLPRGRDGEEGTCADFSASKEHKEDNYTMTEKQDAQHISSSRQQVRPLSFTPPKINLMKFVECDDEQTPPKAQDDIGGKQAETFSYDDSPYSSFYEQIDEEILKEIEDKHIRAMNLKNSKAGNAEESSSKGNNSTVAEPSDLAASAPGTVNLSVTPAYRPPNRMLKKPAVLRSPFLDTAANQFKCNKVVCDVYNAICSSEGRSTRSTSSSRTADMIITYPTVHVMLWDLAASVKPRGELSNTVAEIGVYATNPRGRNAKKRVLPLRVSTFLQSGQIDRKEVTRVFSSASNNLDHRDMVMFPVLQIIKRPGHNDIGHYFLLVLNLRCNRFEVLDSWRGPNNDSLTTCCNTIIGGIKALWKLHYPDSNKDVDSFDPVHIIVPQQNNNYDCGFHMLLHAEYWDGRSVLNFKDKDIPNARKLLTYKWLTHRLNDTDWKALLRF